ncbi:hypothetical protein [Polaromonas sp.]|uniref:hypothetical protein n=1 Tax=Polaromonas sp. TaxID=1869339 RepID=UPI003267A9F0
MFSFTSLFKPLFHSVVFFLSVLAQPAFAQPALSKAPSLDSNTVLFEVRIGQHVLTDSLNAFQFGQKIFLPLGEMSSLMTIAIRAYPEEGAGRGFVRGESRTFSLNTGNRTVTLGDKTSTFDGTDILSRDDDIYVESKLLADWLLVDFDVNLSSLTVKLNPREPLPLQARLARESQLGGLAGRSKPEELNYPRRDNPYRLVDTPFIDQTISLGAQRGNSLHSNNASYTTYIRGDLAGLQASAFLSGTNQSNSSQSRFTVGRSDPAGDLLGPLRARSFALGNVSVPGVANISRSSDFGNGFSLGNVPLDRSTRFASHTLQGDLPPGWDVELYLNNALIGYQQARGDGKYSFDDLTLVYGANEFRLVFHGPQGQIRVERKSFLLDGSLNEPGSFYYNLASNNDAAGLQHSAAMAELGLSKFLTGTLGMVNLEGLNQTRQNYTSMGLNGFVGGALLVGNLTQQANGGTLSELSARTRLAGISVGWNHLQLKDFTSELFPLSADPVRSRDRLRFDGLISPESLGDFPFTLELQRDRLQSGARVIDARALLSTSLGAATLTNLLHVSRNQGARSVDGAFQVSGNAGQFRVGAQASYLVQPKAQLSALAVSADHALGGGYLLNVSSAYTFQDSVFRLSSSLNKNFGGYAVALTGGVTSRREFTVGIQIFTSVAREPRRSQWMMDAVPAAESGAISARVFIDSNGNGVMDDGEEPVKNVGFLVNSSNHPVRTDASGIAYVGHLLGNRNADISVNQATVEDPQLVSSLKGVRVTPRPGNIGQIDFPLVLTGEIDGTVYLVSNERKRGVGNVLIELVDASGEVVTQTRSGSDGFYVLVEVQPGNYSLRVGEEQLNELKLAYSGPRKVSMSPKGVFVNGQDFSLQR